MPPSNIPALASAHTHIHPPATTNLPKPSKHISSPSRRPQIPETPTLSGAHIHKKIEKISSVQGKADSTSPPRMRQHPIERNNPPEGSERSRRASLLYCELLSNSPLLYNPSQTDIFPNGVGPPPFSVHGDEISHPLLNFLGKCCGTRPLLLAEKYTIRSPPLFSHNFS